MPRYSFSRIVESVHYQCFPATQTAIVVGSEKLSKLIIPEIITANDVIYTVVSIGNEAFYKNQHLTEVHLPKTVLMIGERAFAQCANIKKVQADAEKLTLYAGAFAESQQLTEILADKIELLGAAVFSGCNALESFFSLSYFEETTFVGKIPIFSFLNCKKLEFLVLDDGVRIESNAFAQCSIKSLYFWGNADFSENRHTQFKNIKLQCKQTSNIVNLAYDGFTIEIC